MCFFNLFVIFFLLVAITSSTATATIICNDLSNYCQKMDYNSLEKSNEINLVDKIDKMSSILAALENENNKMKEQIQILCNRDKACRKLIYIDIPVHKENMKCCLFAFLIIYLFLLMCKFIRPNRVLRD